MRRLTTTLTLILAATTLTACEKIGLDRQMEVLCKKDGGVKIYERVTLSAHEFDSQGRKRLDYAASQTNREGLLGPNYRFVEHVETVAGSPGDEWKGHLDRHTTQVIRRVDGKLLGESNVYLRVGGDGISTVVHWQPSSRTCPESDVDLINSVLVKTG